MAKPIDPKAKLDEIARALSQHAQSLNTLRALRHPRPDDRSGRRAVTYPTSTRKRLGP